MEVNNDKKCFNAKKIKGVHLLKQFKMVLKDRRFQWTILVVFLMVANYALANQLYNFAARVPNKQQDVLNFLSQMSIGSFAALLGVLSADANTETKFFPYIKLTVLFSALFLFFGTIISGLCFIGIVTENPKDYHNWGKGVYFFYALGMELGMVSISFATMNAWKSVKCQSVKT